MEGNVRRVIVSLLIIQCIFPISLLAQSNILHYEYEIVNDSMYHETMLFYGKDYNTVNQYMISYDSVLINLSRIDNTDSFAFEADTLYQVDGFGILSMEISKQFLRNKATLLNIREATFYNHFDNVMKWVIGFFAVTIVGIPIAAFLGLGYGVKWLFDKGYERLFNNR